MADLILMEVEGALARQPPPAGCESENHETVETALYPRFVDCWGELRTCPICRKRICHADGGADDVDNSIPDICDTCWCEVVTGNPAETGDGDD